MLEMAVEIRTGISVLAVGAYRTMIFTMLCSVPVLRREGQVGEALRSLPFNQSGSL